MSDRAAAATMRFGPEARFELQALERRLLVDGAPAALGSRAFDLLLELASRPGELRSKHELIEAVWPGVVVEEGNLATQISSLRKVLGGDLIATIPGHGYRFAAQGTLATALPDTPVVVAATAGPLGVPPPAPPPLAADALRRTNLPAEPPLLIGRSEDLVALDRLVREHALVTLVGPGGIGKTRLAQAFLNPRREAYRHGVCWVDLSPVADPQMLAPAIATALGLSLGGGDPLEALCGLIAPLQMLVALDNAEHLLDGSARVVQALLDAAPGVRWLVTSQASLQLAAEQVFRLAGLAVPGPSVQVDQALGYGAVALFVERAQAVDLRWRLTEENLPSVVEVCAQLDGVALAIELAAARAPLLGVRRLAAAMGDRLRLLNASRDRLAPERQQTLRAALEWSHGFLDGPEQTVFRRLAVFAGGGSLDTIQQVVADADSAGGLDPWTVLDALYRLVDRSLVAVVDVEGAREPRYRLLDSPRAFALERLQAAGEEAALRLRHLRALAQFCEAAWHAAFSGHLRKDDWSRAFECEADNVREALALGFATGESLLAVQIATSRLMLPARMPVDQRVELVNRLLPHLDDRLPVPLRARAWIYIARAVGDARPDLKLEAAQKAVDLIEGSPAQPGEDFLAYLAWCTVADAAGGRPETARMVKAALARAEALEKPGWPAQRRFYLAVARYLATDQESPEVLPLGRELLRLDLAAGGNGLMVRSSLVDAELANGEAEAAARSGEALLVDLQQGRDEEAMAWASLNLTAAWLALSQLERARSLARQAWPQGRLFDLQPLWACFLADLAAREGRFRAAARLVGYAEASYRARELIALTNEARSLALATRLARAELGEAAFERLRAGGQPLLDEQIEAIAFAVEDTL